jgi:hypothetical protein
MFWYQQAIPAAWGTCFVIFGSLKAIRIKQLIDNSPRSPDATTDHIHPIRLGIGTSIYVTADEKAWSNQFGRQLRAFVILGFASFLFALVVIPLLVRYG